MFMKPCCKWCNQVFESTCKLHTHIVDDHLSLQHKNTICFVCDISLTGQPIDQHMKEFHPQHCLWCVCKVVKREQCSKLKPYCTVHNEICNIVLEKLWTLRKLSKLHKKTIEEIRTENVFPYSMALRLLQR